MRRRHDEADLTEPDTGFQGEGGVGGDQAGRALAELAQQFDVHPNQITNWKAQLAEGVTGVFGAVRPAASSSPDADTSFGLIGDLKDVADFINRIAKRIQGDVARIEERL